MAYHANSCFGNFALCPHGATFSFWVKFGPQIQEHPNLYNSPNLVFFLKRKASDSFMLRAVFSNETHQRKFIGLPEFAPHNWIQIGVTYSKGSGIKVSNKKFH